MKTVSSGFRDALNGIRDLDLVITYYGDDGYYILTTENSNYLLTEDELELSTQKGIKVINKDIIKDFHYAFNSGLFKTICKYVEIELEESIPKGTRFEAKVGVSVNGEYEYVSLGYFYTKDESKYQLDTETYKVTAYDRMVDFMRVLKYTDFLDSTSGTTYTINSLLNLLIKNVNDTTTFTKNEIVLKAPATYVNDDQEVNISQFINSSEITARDIIDDLCEVCGISFYFDKDDNLILYQIRATYGEQKTKASNTGVIEINDGSSKDLYGNVFSGKCVQDGTPTPENPIEIKTVGKIENNETIIREILTNGIDTKYLQCSIGNNELAKVGDSKDTINFIKGIYYKKIDKITFDGSESWSKSSTYSTDDYLTLFINDSKFTQNADCLSNRFKPGQTSDLRTGTDNYIGFAGTSVNIRISTSIIGGTTVTDFKNWLSTHNTTLYYAMKETEEYNIGIQDLSLYDGYNKLTFDSEVPPALAVIAYYDGYSIHDIDDETLKNTNVETLKHYGPINSLEIKNGSDLVLGYVKNTPSIKEYGETKLVISDNMFFIHPVYLDSMKENLFEQIKGLSYDILDIETTGELILEPLDHYRVTYNNKVYETMNFNDDIKISTGLEETLYVDEPEENTTEYTSNTVDEKTIKNALVDIDNANGQIVLKATSDGKIVQATLNADAADGSLFEVQADNINLNGYTTINGNFQIDENGDAKIGNWGIATDSNGGKLYSDNSYNGKTYRTFIQDINSESGEDTWAFSTQRENSSGGLEGTAFITCGGEGWFTSLETQSFINNSLEKNKKNIEKYSGALEEILNTDIYKYNYKNEEDSNKKHIGFVIGENYKYSNDITAENTKKEILGADIYSMCSMCLQAIKEQQEVINELKNEITKIKEGK